MAPQTIEGPFDSIESAQDFMTVLAETILDAMKDLNHQQRMAVRDGPGTPSREFWAGPVQGEDVELSRPQSRRTLNDLRMLKRLILNERLTVDKFNRNDVIGVGQALPPVNRPKAGGWPASGS